MWTSIDLEKEYKNVGGEILTRKNLVERLLFDYKDDVILLSSPGIANILVFKTQANHILRIQEVDDEDEIHVQAVAKSIVKEIKEMTFNKNVYQAKLDLISSQQDVSCTLSKLLRYVSPQLTELSLPSLLVGNLITSVVAKRYTSLQIALAILVERKALVDHLYDYRITCSYDELLRFRTSAAVWTVNRRTYDIIAHYLKGLVQVIADNFDCDISSMNGKKQTHSLAMIVIQPDDNENDDFDRAALEIPRLKKHEIRDADLPDTPHVEYTGPKKPVIPKERTIQHVSSLKVLAAAAAGRSLASQNDLQFLKDITTHPETPEYSGYNTKNARETGQGLKKKSKTMYLPLIDASPTDPSTMMTALVEAMRLTDETCQPFTVITCDQQLYKILVDLLWVYPSKFENVIVRLGGMHLLMSFIGCIGNLMSNSGLEDILSVAFGGVEKMLSGKKFPQNFRALRMIVELLLGQRIINIISGKDMEKLLNELRTGSKTSKLWVDCLIKPVLLTMLYVRAEREGDWALHLYAVSKMIPYFFAAGHHHYARYATYYLNDMKNLPSEIEERFLRGEHTTRHQRGLWNGIWSDMHIETTFMKYGKGPGGLIGVTLQQRSVKKWAYSLHVTTQILKDLAEMRERKSVREITVHKEEQPGRIKSDATDREKLRAKIEHCIDPLDAKSHPNEIVNICTGAINKDSAVNVENAVSIGSHQLSSFINGLPESFAKTIEKKVMVLKKNKKSVRIGDVQVYDTEAIYARIMCLIALKQIDLETALNYELSPIPTSMFQEDGTMRFPTAKSDFKNNLEVEVSCRYHPAPDSVVIDGSAIFWTIEWPKQGTVTDLMDTMYEFIESQLMFHDVYFVFDRYYEYSVKGSTRENRVSNIANHHHFSLSTPLPSREKALSSSSNKQQLIDITVSFVSQKVADGKFVNTLVITGSDETPLEITAGSLNQREDLRTTHEEADVIMIQQCYKLIHNGGSTIVKIISDDTDVFSLACNFFPAERTDVTVLMEPTKSSRMVTDIGATVEKHKSIISSILAAYVLSGCDSVCHYQGIGKKTVIKVLQIMTLKHLLDPEAAIEDVLEEATQFMGLCYGIESGSTMSEKR